MQDNLILKKISAIFSKYKKLIKISYLVIVLALLVYAINNIFHQVSLDKLKNIFKYISANQFILLIITGIFAVLSMIIYDLIYSNKINQNISKIELIKNSFIINSFTNTLGGGGAIGAGLRSYLLENNSNKNQIEIGKLVSQIALFTLTGLVINDLIGIIFNFNYFWQLPFIIKLLCLLFPLYLFVPFIIKNTFNQKEYCQLLIGSTVEWISAIGLFMLIGYLLGIQNDLFHIYLAVVYAGIIGAISLIPGGLGSFDSAIIFSLHLLGIPVDLIIVWDLIYRIVYYFIPLLISTILFLITLISKRIFN